MSSAKQKKTAAFVLPPLHASGLLLIRNFWIQAAVLVAVSIGFYANSIKNEYALDDDITIRQNTFVQRGFGGIGEILTSDAYTSFYRSMGVEQQLAGGRYRPLSIVSFAIEQQLFGDCYGERFEEVRDSVLYLQKQASATPAQNDRLNKLSVEKLDLDKKITATNLALAPIRHGLQILWYALMLVVLLVFLRECVFRTNTDLAFLSVLLFAMLPVHTEVVANVKSRDEIFSLLFCGLTFISVFRYVDYGKLKSLVWGGVWLLLAFLSKEYAVVMPVLIGIGLYLFRAKAPLPKLPLISVGAAVLILYMIMRFGSVGLGAGKVDKNSLDPLNEPYLKAKTHERIASKIDRLDDYLLLLVAPHDLAADYSYQHFPYSKFSNWQVWLSFLIYAGLVILFFRLFLRRHPMAFAMAIYLGFFALVCNLLMDIGATMGERLIFHSSLGFAMALAWGLVWLAERVGEKGRLIPVVAVVLLAIPYGWLTIERNPEWKNDETLFLADVQKRPNSALCNGNAGAQLMNRALTFNNDEKTKNKDSLLYWSGKAMPYLLKAVELHPRYVNSWLNLGLCYYYRDRNQEAADCWGNAQQNFRNNPILLGYLNYFKNPALKAAIAKDYEKASYWYGLAATANPGDAGLWADYAGSSFMAEKFGQAEGAFQKAADVDADAKQYYNEASRIDINMIAGGKRLAHVNDSLQKRLLADPKNPEYLTRYAESLLNTVEFYPTSRRLLNEALAILPNDPNIRLLSDSLTARENRLAAKLAAEKKKR